MTSHAVVTAEQWSLARRELLQKEKDFQKLRDQLSEARRALPWERVAGKYAFEGAAGRESLADLFGPHRQLIVYHFMFDPAWEVGCKSCSYVADNLSGAVVHLAARDTSFAAISRAPIAKIEGFKQRMGWTFPWLSSNANDFNYDFHVTIDEAHPEYNFQPDYYSRAKELKRGPQAGEAPGLSVFLLEGEQVHHAYSTYTRGLDLFLNTYNLLDHTPLGRQENGRGMAWLRHHDKY